MWNNVYDSTIKYEISTLNILRIVKDNEIAEGEVFWDNLKASSLSYHA